MHIEQFLEKKLIENGLNSKEAKKEAEFLYEEFVWLEEVDQIPKKKAFLEICSMGDIDPKGLEEITEF